jgi:hypothetical protein
MQSLSPFACALPLGTVCSFRYGYPCDLLMRFVRLSSNHRLMIWETYARPITSKLIDAHLWFSSVDISIVEIVLNGRFVGYCLHLRRGVVPC